jgi:glycosyltransferase involved in cell wall biosynthesis
MKIAIFTTFYGVDEAYSLCRVVEDQIRMLRRGDDEIILLANDGFKASGVWSETTVRTIPKVYNMNNLPSKDEPKPNRFDEDVEKMYQALKENLKDIHICLGHDIIFQNGHIVHNIAARKLAQERKDLWWLHWVHSTARPTFMSHALGKEYKLDTAFPNSYVIYPNDGDNKRVALNFEVDINDVRLVPHAMDVYDFYKLEPLARELADKYQLLSVDVAGLYPVRLDRGKQPHKIIEIFRRLKDMGKTVRLIISDFHSTGGDKVTYRNEMIDTIKEYGMEQEVHFISQHKKETEYLIPHTVINDLFKLTNVFVLPSQSETYSLIAQEAALAGNIVLLNHDFPPLRSVYGNAAYYFPFSSSINSITWEDGSTDTKVDDPDHFYGVMAKTILYELNNNRLSRLKNWVRQKRNIDYVYNNFLSPLIHEGLYKASAFNKGVGKLGIRLSSNKAQNIQTKKITKVEKAFIIPAYTNYEYFKNCLASIHKYNKNYAVIVIDQTLDGLIGKNHKNEIDEIIRPEYNLGFATAMNDGVALAQEKYDPQYYVLCNEDVEFINEKWWEGILKRLNTGKYAGVNPNSPIGQYGEHVVDLDSNYDTWGSQYPDLEGTCMWCTVIPKDKWKEIGSLDSKFYPAGGEDYDWHYRVYQKGYRVISTSSSWVYHWWNRYNKEISSEKVQPLPSKSELYWNDLHKKWGKGFTIYYKRGYSEAYNPLSWRFNGNPRFSIVIPTYNRGDKIGRAIESVLNQGYSDYQLIVVDDASTDNTKEIVSSFNQRNKDLTGSEILLLTNSERMERVISWKKGFANVDGDWVLQLGSDDELAPDLFTKMAEHIKDNENVKLFNYGWNRIGEDKTTKMLGWKFSKGEEFKSGRIAAGTFMWHRSLMQYLNLPDAKDPYSLADMAEIPGYGSKTATLGNPWGEDFLIFYRLTRKVEPMHVDLIGEIVHIRGSE